MRRPLRRTFEILQQLWPKITVILMDRNFRNPTLGPVLETYGPNIRSVAIVLVVGLLFCTVALLFAMDLRERAAWIVFYVLTLLWMLLLLRYLLSKAWLHEVGISYRGMLGYGEMRWLEVARLYFGSYELHAQHIPLGTFYRLKLVSIQGQRVSLGERLRRADHLAGRIARFTFEPLLQKATHEFSADAAVDFGAIHLARQDGVTIDKTFFDKNLRWEEIAGYDFDSVYVRFHQFKGLSWKVQAERVPNARVLEALLDGVMHKVWTGSSSSQ